MTSEKPITVDDSCSPVDGKCRLYPHIKINTERLCQKCRESDGKLIAGINERGKPAQRNDKRDCRPCKDKMMAKMKMQILQDRAAAFTGRIVVIMPVRDEGERALETVRNLRASKAPGTDLHFFIVNDGCTDGCCDVFAQRKPRDITLVHAPVDGGHCRQVGQGIARSLAVMQNPDADGFYSIDAHETMDTQYGIERLILQAQATGGFIMARSLNLAKNRANVGVGCHLGIKGGGESLSFLGVWSREGEADETGMIPVKILCGACYAFTPKAWHTIGGSRESYGLYGMFDTDISIAAKFCGLPVHCDADVKSGHWYRAKRPYTMSGRWRWWAWVECFRSMFRPDIFERVFAPAARHIAFKLKDPMLTWLLTTPRFVPIQAEFETRKTISDEEVVMWMGIKI